MFIVVFVSMISLYVKWNVHSMGLFHSTCSVYRSHPPTSIFSSKSAFSPLMPASFESNSDRYNYLQSQIHSAKRFLAAPYSGTGYLSTVLQSDSKRNESDKSEDDVDLQ